MQAISEEEIRNHYIRLLHGVPDAIIVLSARVRNAPNRKQGYTTTAYSDSDPFGMLGGKARIIAGAEISRYFPEAKVVTTTRGPDLSGKLVIDADIMAEELKRLGIPDEQLLRENRSTNTLTELQEIVKLIAAKRFSFSVILTSDYHVRRCETMYERLEALTGPSDALLRRSITTVKQENLATVFVAAEPILHQRSSHYTVLIEKARQSSEYAKRIQFEQQGIAAIEAGDYTPTGKTWKIVSFVYGTQVMSCMDTST